MKEVAIIPCDMSLTGVSVGPVTVRQVKTVEIDVDTLETLAHGVSFARDVAQTLYVHFNDPAMERTQKKIHDAQKEAMRLVGLARRPG